MNLPKKLNFKISSLEYEAINDYVLGINKTTMQLLEKYNNNHSPFYVTTEHLVLLEFIDTLEAQKNTWLNRISNRNYTVSIKFSVVFCLYKVMQHDPEVPNYLLSFYNGLHRQLINYLPYKIVEDENLELSMIGV